MPIALSRMRKFLQTIILFILTTQISYGQNYLYGDKKWNFLHRSDIKVYGEQVDSAMYTIEVRIDKKTSYSTILDTLRGGDKSFVGKQYKIKIEDNKYTLYPGHIKLVRRPFPINGDPYTNNFDLIYNDQGYWRNFDSVSVARYGMFWLRSKYIMRKDSSYMDSLWARLTNIDLVKKRTYTNARVHLAILYLTFGIIQPIFF
jgi:hypothetical protein